MLNRDALSEELVLHTGAPVGKDSKGSNSLIISLYQAAFHGPWAVFSAPYGATVAMSQLFIVRNVSISLIRAS